MKRAYIKNEKGIVLIISLLLLLVATVVGITAISTSTTNVMMAGNKRLTEVCLSAADSGVSATVPVLRAVVGGGSTVEYQDILQDPNFGAVDEPSDTATGSADITIRLASTTVNIDVDYLYSGRDPGCAIEFASGYEGVGKGAGTCISTYYAINSVCTGAAGSQAEVCAIYRYK